MNKKRPSSGILLIFGLVITVSYVMEQIRSLGERAL